MSDVGQIYDRKNLRRAWRWIRSNADATYKSYFRHLYRNYAVCEEALLDDLADRLKRGVYAPTKATKLFFPKPSGILRPYSLLTVEDQIVYQAAINVVAEKLFPRVNHRYNKQVFGHLYAGKTSTWFYRKWNDGYKAFNDGARAAYSEGFVFTASFDLTACYDSLDHRVLRHFLEKLGLEKEFNSKLTDRLEEWTDTGKGIFHNHGIPQGPQPSGLLSEVVLTHFDSLNLKRVDFRYYRYVDDIRLFAKNEQDLRRLLVSLDLLSKDVGLFPQSAKISIHKVLDIEDELKSISNPFETVFQNDETDQKKLLMRITELSPRHSITNPTRFKYLLAHAKPASSLTKRLWRIYDKHPDIYKSFCSYLRRYKILPRVAAEEAISAIKAATLYHSVRAEFVAAVDGRLPRIHDIELALFLREWRVPSLDQPDLLAASTRFLVRTGHLTGNQVAYSCRRAKSWWARATMVDDLTLSYLGEINLTRILDDQISNSVGDVSLAAAWKSFATSRKPASRQKIWNPAGAIFLKEVGFIQRNTADFCGVALSLSKLDNKIPAKKWKAFFESSYSRAEKQAVEVAALSGTNITALVNALDVFNDLLLNALFAKDGTIGAYNLGKIGSVLNSPTSRFAKKYPATFQLAKEVHETRYQSMYSHPLIKTTGKSTRKISFKFLVTARRLLVAATSELSTSRVV